MRGDGTLTRPMADAKRFHVTTFGCQMNEHDSERMKGMLESLGYDEAAARDDAGRVVGLEPLRLTQVPHQAVVRRLPYRAGVEQDQVGAVAVGRLPVAEHLEHPLHALGVVLVHLAPEGGDVVALAHRRASSVARLYSLSRCGTEGFR